MRRRLLQWPVALVVVGFRLRTTVVANVNSATNLADVKNDRSRCGCAGAFGGRVDSAGADFSCTKFFFRRFSAALNCKYYPSCSNYAQEAVQKHGARRGAWLALKRLGRCRPFVKGGFDPVPEPGDL